MIATFDGQDYMLALERHTNDIVRLRDCKLETGLTSFFGDEDLGKRVTLEVADNRGSDGIEVTYLPEDASSWKKIQTIQVKINERALGYVEERRVFGTRYNGSDKIEIHDGNPRPGLDFLP